MVIGDMKYILILMAWLHCMQIRWIQGLYLGDKLPKVVRKWATQTEGYVDTTIIVHWRLWIKYAKLEITFSLSLVSCVSTLPF